MRDGASEPGAVSERALGLLAALVIFNVVLSTASQDAMFLAHHGRDRIPPAMLLGSLLTAATSLGLSRVLRRLSPPMILRAVLLMLGCCAAGFAAWNAAPGRASTFAYFLFVEMGTTLGVAATWTYFQAPLDPSYIRRLLPRLGVWAGVGGVVAGGLIPLLQRLHDLPQLLIAVSACAWLAAALLVRARHSPKQHRGARRQTGLRQVLRLPLLPWLVLGTAGIVWMGLLLQYETRVSLQRHLSPPEIARTMGVLLAATSITGIFVQGLLTTPILERWGVGLALAILPITVALLLGVYVTLPLWVLIALAFLVDKTLRPNLHRPAESCLLAAVAPQSRPALMLVLGSIVQPLTKAAGSLVLWGVAASVPEQWIVLCALSLTGGLVLLSTRWGRLYARTLQETLEEGSVDMADPEDADEGEALVPLIDGPRLRLLLGAIDGPSPRSRELALEMLRPHRSELVRRAMLERLDSPSPEVRIAALRWLSDDPLPDLAERLRRRFADPDVPAKERIALLEAAGRAAPALLGDQTERWLAVPDVELRSAVIRVLFGATGEHRALAQRGLMALLQAQDPEEVIAGLRLVRDLGDAQYLPAVLLVRLRFAEDSEVHRRVRREVLVCLPSLPGAEARAPLWETLGDQKLAHVAVRSLAACGAEVVPEVVAALGAPVAPMVRHNLVKLLGLIPSQLGIPALLVLLGDPDRSLQLEALKALGQLRRRDLWAPTEAQRQQIDGYILDELRHGLRLRRSRDLLRRYRMPSSLVLRELDGQLDAAQQRVFRALGLLVSQEILGRVFNALRSPTSPHRDQARELLRSLAGTGPLTTGSLVLFDQGLPFSDECYRPPLLVFTERSQEAVVAWLASTHDPWILAALRHDPGYPVELPPTQELEDPMKASLDILLFLKDVALFEALTNQQLVEVAKLAEKVEVPAGKVLFAQGEPADYLYLVRTGKLLVKVSGQEVARLGPGECAGEMAVLSGTERTATVEAAERCQLLQFEGDHFLQLLETYPEIGRGLLRSLVKRLAMAGGPKKGVRPATMTGMVWGPEGPPSLPPHS